MAAKTINERSGNVCEQLALPLKHTPQLSQKDFFIGNANERANAFIQKWPHWPSNIALLVGPKGSGKSHLTSIWSSVSNALPISAWKLGSYNPIEIALGKPVILEMGEVNGSQIDQKALFHIINAINTYGNYAVITSRLPLACCSLTIPDLISRLRAATPLILSDPDDDLLRGILAKLFKDYSIVVTPHVLSYIVRCMERSYSSAISLVQNIDCVSLSTGSAVTVRMVQRVMKMHHKTS